MIPLRHLFTPFIMSHRQPLWCIFGCLVSSCLWLWHFWIRSVFTWFRIWSYSVSFQSEIASFFFFSCLVISSYSLYNYTSYNNYLSVIFTGNCNLLWYCFNLARRTDSFSLSSFEAAARSSGVSTGNRLSTLS